MGLLTWVCVQERLAYSHVMRIGIAGIAGRMGVQLVQHVARAGADLAGGIARPREIPPHKVALYADLAALAAVSDVIVDFTHADAVEAHASACVAAHVPWVLGTTGLTAADQEAVARAALYIPVVQAANFAPGVVLVQALAQQLAAALPAETHDAEIVEMHHRQKVDAPSGTALALGRAVAAGRGVDFADIAEPARQGHTGPRRQGSIGFAALRGGQMVGEHSVIFAADDEQIVLTHRAMDRGMFAAGAVRAALWTSGRAPGLYSMMDVLGLTER
jgi:4-hydroxy-tetrahydrodipicolinate reductase